MSECESRDRAVLDISKAYGTGQVGEITLCYTSSHHCLELPMLRDLEEIFANIEDNYPNIPLILSSNKEDFCHGLNLHCFWEGTTPNTHQFHKFEKLVATFERLNNLKLCVIDGKCDGAGVELAMACDLRLVTERASFAINEVAQGFCPGMTTWRLPKFVGLGRARDLTLTGRRLDCHEALQMGLADRLICSPCRQTLTEVLSAIDTSHNVAASVSRRLLNEAYAVQQENAIGSSLAAQARCLNSLEQV